MRIQNEEDMANILTIERQFVCRAGWFGRFVTLKQKKSSNVGSPAGFHEIFSNEHL